MYKGFDYFNNVQPAHDELGNALSLVILKHDIE